MDWNFVVNDLSDGLRNTILTGHRQGPRLPIKLSNLIWNSNTHVGKRM